MNIIGQRLLLIISDPWDAYKKIKVTIAHSFTDDGVQYFLVKNSGESSDLYLLSPRYSNEELFNVFNNICVSVAIATLNNPYVSAEDATVVKNSHYMGIGSIELCAFPNES